MKPRGVLTFYLAVLVMTFLLQWNLRGFRANHSDLLTLAAAKTPAVIALQETKLRHQHSCNLHQYKSYRYDSSSGTVAHGGTAVLIHPSVPSHSYRLRTDLQAAAAVVDLHRLQIVVVSLYIPPGGNLPSDLLQDLIQQLPNNFLILGDLNTHNTIWGSAYTNRRGRHLEEIINRNSLCILNNGSPTHITLPSGSTSAIDLSLASATVADRFQWKTHETPCGSDHFPIWLWSDMPHPGARTPQWNFKKADWASFTADCNIHLDFTGESTDTLNEHVRDSIVQSASKHIPKTSALPKRIPVPWWSEDCRIAIRERRRRDRIFKRHPTTENLIRFQKAKAVARKTVREAKRKSWITYITTINRFTPLSSIWRRIQRISGRGSPIQLPALTLPNGNIITNPQDVANHIGEKWAERWTLGTTHPTFLRYKRASERSPIDFACSESLAFNDVFTFDELERAIRHLRSTAAGPDSIHNDMLKKLSDQSLSALLSFYNHIWTSHEFPSGWREAVIIPILKQGKDGTDALHYRPIALTSCVCKLLESMVNRRLVWFLENTGFFDIAQCGFRKNRSTIDHIVSLDTAVRQSFASKQHTFAVLFDIEKAYDTAWRHAILDKLRNAGIRGHMGYFLANFIRERSYRVRIGSTLSNSFIQESGVPQGSVLSVTLFGVLINDICCSLPPNVRRSLFVDDFAIWVSSSTSLSAQRQLQLCINSLTKWSLSNGFKFSTEKTVCIHFCRRTRYCPDITLRMYQQRIPLRDEVTFLGVTLDKRLSYGPHIARLKDKCTVRMNILKVTSRMSYGADRTTLLRLYRSLIRSVIDYASIAYDGALDSTKQPLDSVHHACIRIATGAFRTSRRSSLLVDAGEHPLDLRRKRLSMIYACKIKQNPNHPAHDWIFDRTLTDRLSLTRRSSSRALCLRAHSWLENAEIDLNSLSTRYVGKVEPWRRRRFYCDLSLLQHSKSSTVAHELKQYALEKLDSYNEFRSFFTDGSKGPEGVGCAFISGTVVRRFKLPDIASVYISELYAIYQALKHIRRHEYSRCLIVTDSASSAMALRSQTDTSALVTRILELLTNIYSEGSEVKLLWVPSHIGIEGNEKADEAARAAVHSSCVRPLKVEADDFKPLINRIVSEEWQGRWDKEPDCALRRLRPNTSTWESSNRRNRVEEVALTRLRIGHCYATHSHLLTKGAPPVCDHCGAPLTVKHVLSPRDICEPLRAEKLRYFPDVCMGEVLGNQATVPIKKVLLYLRGIHFNIVYRP